MHTPPPTTTRADLALRVAERVRLLETDAATGLRAAPTDAHDTDRIARAINDAVREFADLGDWRCMVRTATITIGPDADASTRVAGDPARTLLPPGTIQVHDPVRWRAGTAGGVVPLAAMELVMGRNFSFPTRTGLPEECACDFVSSEDLPAHGPDGRPRMEIVVSPAPSREVELMIRLEVYPAPLDQDASPCAWPPVHDETIVALAVRAFLRGDRPAGDPAVARADAESATRLAISRQRDGALLRSPGEFERQPLLTRRGRGAARWITPNYA